jgi:hypothetical protein
MSAENEAPDKCSRCGAALLSVLYYGADEAPVGGHSVCANCGPRSAIELTAQSDLRRNLLERKAS